MKKLLSILIGLCMLFSLALSVSSVGTPEAPEYVSISPSGEGTPNYMKSAHDMSASGDVLYAAMNTDGMLNIINISNPSNITIINSTGVASTPEDLFIVGDIVFVASNSGDAVTSIDVSDPNVPVILDTLSITNANGIWIDGNVAYVTTNSDYFYTVDVTDPTNMSILDSVNGAGTPYYLNSPADVGYLNGVAYVATRLDNSFVAFNVSNPSDITLISNITGTGSPNYMGYCEELFIDESSEVAYVGCYDDSSIVSVDISDPKNMYVMDSIMSSGPPNYLDYVYDIEVLNDILYAVTVWDNALVVIDVSDPTNMTFLGVNSHASISWALSLAISDDENTLFLGIDDDPYAILVFDITAPTVCDWECTSYDDCVPSIIGGLKNCLSVNETIECDYTGDYSEYIGECNYCTMEEQVYPGNCVNGLRTMTYVLTNDATCCDLTGNDDDCTVTIPYQGGCGYSNQYEKTDLKDITIDAMGTAGASTVDWIDFLVILLILGIVAGAIVKFGKLKG